MVFAVRGHHWNEAATVNGQHFGSFVVDETGAAHRIREIPRRVPEEGTYPRDETASRRSARRAGTAVTTQRSRQNFADWRLLYTSIDEPYPRYVEESQPLEPGVRTT